MPQDNNGGWFDDRPQQATLDVGDAAQRTARRAERGGEIVGSEAFVDVDEPTIDPGEQTPLVETSETIEGQADLLGGEATVTDTPDWSGPTVEPVPLEENIAAAEQAGVLEPIGPNGDAEHAPPDVFEPDPIEIEFHSLDGANAARDRYPDALDDSDSRRTKTVRIWGNAPDDVVDAIALEATESRAHLADQFGQVELTRAERAQLEDRRDWDGRMLFHAQSAKAVLQGSGVDDWIAYYDPQLTVDEHRSIAEQARRDERGARMDEHAREGAFDAMAAGAVGAPVQQRQHASDAVIEHCMEISDEHDPEVFRAILAGEDPGVSNARIRRAKETIEDIRAEFGHEFVERAAEECHRERRPAPEPLDPVRFERDARTGWFTPPNPQPDPVLGVDRSADTGLFVTQDRVPAGVGRGTETGRFWTW
ncbi:hypothetical protein [Natrarchaeobius chitinivorans]|uniref:hypothetical protein n=1 Tax=Natrarchaeobius chitinivorans TaxID=1679083 RepID=UPI001A9FB3D5|nr:hypothetical protein [Natrarchaeobius chitinivorans]